MIALCANYSFKTVPIVTWNLNYLNLFLENSDNPLKGVKYSSQPKMAFTFIAFGYMIALLFSAFLIFFAIYHIIAFDELKTDYKNPIDQCNSLNPLGELNLLSFVQKFSRNLLFR